MAPTTGILDAFTHTNDPLSNHASWDSLIAGALGEYKSNGSQAIQSNIANSWTGNAWNTSYAGPCEAYITLVTLPADTHLWFLGLAEDYSAGATFDGYSLRITFASGNDTVELVRLDAFTPTTLDSDSIAISASDKFMIRYTATKLSVERYSGGAWAEILSASSGLDYSGPFYPFVATNDDELNNVVDDLGGGEYVAPTGATIPRPLTRPLLGPFGGI